MDTQFAGESTSGENLDVSWGWVHVDERDELTLPSFVGGKVLDHRVDPCKEDILNGYCGVKEDLGDVVACCSRGDLVRDHILGEANGSHIVDAMTCGSSDGQVGMVMIHGEMDDLDLPCMGVEVVNSENG